MKTSKYFCPMCENLQQYNNLCNKCNSCAIAVGLNTRFAKHPKPIDYKEVVQWMAVSINHQKAHYSTQNWSEKYITKLKKLFLKWSPKDLDKIDAVINYKEPSKSSYTEVNGRRLPKVLEDFSKRFGTHPKHRKVYTSTISIWFPFDNSMNSSINANETYNIFKVHKTYPITKEGNEYMFDCPTEFKWDNSVVNNHRYFLSKLHCQIFTTELKRYVLQHPDEFPDFITTEAQENKVNCPLEKFYPEMLI